MSAASGRRRVQLRTGVTIACIKHGDPAGRPVLLLPPWVESAGCFDRLVRALPAPMRVYALDLRGHGEADKPEGGYALGDFADDVDAFMDAVGVPAAVLVGSSSGGYVAQEVAVRFPHRVAGLVLVGSPRSLVGRPPFADEVDQLVDPVDPAWVEASLAWFPRYHDVPHWYLQDRIRDGVRTPAHVWRAALAGLAAAVPPTESGTITAPTLIIWGAQDEFIRADMDVLAAAIPASRLLVYEDTGHLVLWEQPDRVAHDVVEFVATLGW
ncbi:MAG: alpha/beta hydrolase [Jiangellaceae bacterium]|nr:alpha/beta hydrolase [Jiangellaceae bacterium]